MSPEWRSNILRFGFLISVIYWGWNVAFNRIEYISPTAKFGLFEVIPLVFIIPLSFTLLYAVDCIRREKKIAYVLFIVFFFILWSTPYLMEEQVRDWDAYWHGFASFRMTDGIFDHGNSVFTYASEFPGGFMFFAVAAEFIGAENFLLFLKFVPLLGILVTSLGLVLFFRMMEKAMPEKKMYLRYALFLSAIINPFFAFHLSPATYGTMLIFIFFAVLFYYIWRKNRMDWRLLLVLGLFLAGLALAHPTTLLFAALLIAILPFYHVLMNRKTIERRKLALILAVPIILAVSGIIAILFLPRYVDSVILGTLQRLVLGLFEALKSPEILSRYISGFTVATSLPSLLQKIFFAVTVPMMLFFYLKREKNPMFAGIALTGIAYLLILVGISAGFFLERAFIFLSIPIAYALVSIDLQAIRKIKMPVNITLDKRTLITLAIVFALFIPTFYWRECSVMFTDEELESMELSWKASGDADGIKLAEHSYPFYFLIGENNTYQYYTYSSNPPNIFVIYSKSNWADYNLNIDENVIPPPTGGNVIFSSEWIKVYYLE